MTARHPDAAALAAKHGLTDAEADLLVRRTDGTGVDVGAAAEDIKADRVGPAKIPQEQGLSAPSPEVRQATEDVDSRLAALEAEVAALRQQRAYPDGPAHRVAAQGVATVTDPADELVVDVHPADADEDDTPAKGAKK